jgi:LCP family protein required for cell wall assembly
MQYKDPESKSKSKASKHDTKPDFVYDPDNKDQNNSDEESLLASQLDPMGKEDQIIDPKLEKRARRRKKAKRIILFVLLFIFLAGGGAFAYLFSRANKISTNPFNFSTKLKGESEGRVNILLLGVGDPGHDGETLADTNMVVSLDTKNNKVAMISVPRDTRVFIPSEGYVKINNAHAIGQAKTPPKGIELAQKTVEDTLGIPIQYYVRANFSGLKDAVDAVGGIEVDVKEPLNDPEYPCDKNQYKSCGFKISAGPTKMDGSTALKYARCRKGTCGDDFGRAIRQQEVLQAVRTKAVSSETLTDPKKLASLIDAAANNISTNMSLSEIQRAYELSKKVPTENITSIVFSTNPNGFLKQDPSSSDLLPVGGNFDEIKKFVKEIFTVGALWSEDAKIIVENGTATVGLAGKFEAKLANAGVPIQILAIQNATTKDYSTSQIIDYSGGKKPQTIKYLEDLLGVKATLPAEASKSTGSQDITVILGSDYADKVSQTGTASE